VTNPLRKAIFTVPRIAVEKNWVSSISRKFDFYTKKFLKTPPQRPDSAKLSALQVFTYPVAALFHPSAFSPQ